MKGLFSKETQEFRRKRFNEGQITTLQNIAKLTIRALALRQSELRNVGCVVYLGSRDEVPFVKKKRLCENMNKLVAFPFFPCNRLIARNQRTASVLKLKTILEVLTGGLMIHCS